MQNALLPKALNSPPASDDEAGNGDAGAQKESAPLGDASITVQGEGDRISGG